MEKPKQKVTTLWSRGKLKRVVVVDPPKGKITGPPSNENGVSICKQCNENCMSSLSTPCNLCCERETHVSLNNVGEYVVFPVKNCPSRFFQFGQQDCCYRATFCGYSNSAKLPRVNCSETLTIGIQTGTMLVSSELSNSVLMNWGADYPNNKFKHPHGYKVETVNTDQNCVVAREHCNAVLHPLFVVYEDSSLVKLV